MRAVLAVLFFIIMVVLFFIYVGDDDGARGRDLCGRFSKEQGDRILSTAKRAGIVDRGRGHNLVVDERVWYHVPHDDKVMIALAAFCQIHDRGRGMLTIEGLLSGDSIATVNDGSYFD